MSEARSTTVRSSSTALALSMMAVWSANSARSLSRVDLAACSSRFLRKHIPFLYMAWAT